MPVVGEVKFDDYYRDQFPALARFAGILGATGDDAREVAQRAFVDLVPVFDAVRTPGPWLRVTAMNHLAEVRGLLPAQQLADSDDLVVKVLLTLPKRQREALAWSVGGYPSKVIAGVLRVARDTAAGHLRQAITRLGFLAAANGPREQREAVLRKVDEVVGRLVADRMDVDAGVDDVRRRVSHIRKHRGARPNMVAVGAGAVAKTALAQEAERLADVTVGWEDAAVRLAEIVEGWPAAGVVDAATEEVLWDRVVAAHERFREGHAEPGPIPETVPERVGPDVVKAEQGLLDLLMRTGFAGPAWDTVARVATEYCVATVVAWLRAGHLPPEADLDPETRAGLARPWAVDELTVVATDVAARTLISFRHSKLLTNRWRPSDESTIAGELCDGCVAALPEALRGHAVRVMAATPVGAPPSGGIGWSAVVLRDAGYHDAEIAEVLRLPDEAAVARAVARHREEAGDV